MLKDEKIRKILKGGLKHSIQNNAYCFLPGDRLPRKTTEDSLLGELQEFLKEHGKFYYLLVKAFAPVLPSQSYRKKISALLSKYDENSVILNLGSGPIRAYGRADVINVDLFAFDEVDVVGDVMDLPVDDGSVDFTINTALIEHVDSPEKVIQEMSRVLRVGGEIFCYIPFVTPYHAAPHDFFRWTISGVQRLFSEFDSVEIGIGAGPTCGMLWVIQEWLAILFSFGSQKLHDILFIILMVLTAPLKLLDVLLAKLPCAHRIASGFYVVGRKA